MSRPLHTVWSVGLVVGAVSLGVLAEPAWGQDKVDEATAKDIAAVEKNLFTDAKGPRFTLAERMEHHMVPGVSVAVIRNGRVAWAKGYGRTEAKGGMAVTATTLFQAASLSKPLAALLALLLVEQGKLDLDGEVNQKLKRWQIPANEFTKKQPVTLRHLLSHSGGVTVHGFLGYHVDDSMPSLVQILKGEKPSTSPALVVNQLPGSAFRYSGGGYCITEALIEDVSGEAFAKLARQRVMDPLGMKLSHHKNPVAVDNVTDAVGHNAKGEPIPGKRRSHPELAAAGLYTTPTEYAQLLLLLMNNGTHNGKRVLSEKLAGEMLKKQAPNAPIGLGWFLEPDGFGHGGSNVGFRCLALAMPGKQSGLVIMTNGDNGGALIGEIVRSIKDYYGI
jgi:CubicO group peptidase (beta-lactamase class C family)